MTIRVSHQKNYTCITNVAIRDKRLSYKARGIHHLLLSYPDGWQVKIEHLVDESDVDGRTAVASGLHELEDFGYLTRQQTRDPHTGRLGDWETVISEHPHSETRVQDDCDRVSRKQKTRKRVNRNQETCDIINTDLDQITKKEVTISPLTPPSIAEPKEGGDLDVRFESIEQEPSSHSISTLPGNLESIKHCNIPPSGVIIPVSENNSPSRITKPNGSEQFPWEQVDPVKGWVIEEGFLKYIAIAVKDYSQFKDLPLRRFMREVVNYANKAHFDNERRSKLLGYWQDYRDESAQVLPNVELTVSQVIDEASRNLEREQMRQALRKPFKLGGC